MQDQRAIVAEDETIIERRERVQLEVNSAAARKSAHPRREPSAAGTKPHRGALGSERRCERSERPRATPGPQPSTLRRAPRGAGALPAARCSPRSPAALGAAIGCALLQWGTARRSAPCAVGTRRVSGSARFELSSFSILAFSKALLLGVRQGWRFVSLPSEL